MVEIFIENIIASATLSNGLDLEKIINTLPNCEYNPNQFPGVIFKPGDPPIFILLFNTGKVMVTAAKSIEDVEKGMELIESELNKAGLITPEEEIREEKKSEEPEEVAEEVEGEEPSEEVKEGEEAVDEEVEGEAPVEEVEEGEEAVDEEVEGEAPVEEVEEGEEAGEEKVEKPKKKSKK